MAEDVRPEPFEDEDDAVERGMTVAAWVTVLTIGLLAVAASCGWLSLMHRAGTGKGLW